MNEINDCKAAVPTKKNMAHYLRKWYDGALDWMYNYLWLTYCYRHVMRWMHNFNLHYTTEVSVIEASSDYKDYFVKKHLHCRWCGLRGDILKNKYYIR